MTGLADCNNFFVSCERSLDPSLEGIPVVVLSNNDGCAIARSNEAKRLGIKMGQPAFELRSLIASGKLTALSGNHLLYRDISLKVHSIFRRFVPAAIDYSVDESFLDFSGIPDDVLPSIAEGIRRTCLEELRIPVTIGIAATKTLAKICTHSCKHRGEGVGVLTDRKEIESELNGLAINELWGIGRRLTRRLTSEGVYSIGDFYRRPLIWVRSTLGVNGERSWRELHGESCIELNHVDRAIQNSVSESRTFPFDTDSYDYIRARIAIYTADCARKLRAMNGLTRQLTVYLASNRFHTENGYYAPSAGMRFERPTSDTTLLVSTAIECLRGIITPGLGYKRAGVILSDIIPAGPVTPSLFDELPDPADIRRAGTDRKRAEALDKAIDRINRDIGAPRLRLASQLTPGHPGHNDGYSSSFQAPSRR